MEERAIKRCGPVTTEVIEGKPIRVGERELVPLVRVTSGVRRRAFVGDEGVDAQGWGFVHMRPVAIKERDGAGERRIPIQDKTAQALGGLLLAAFIIPLLLALAVRLTGKT